MTQKRMAKPNQTEDRRAVLLLAQLKEEEGNLVQDHDKKEEADLDHSLTNQCIIPSF